MFKQFIDISSVVFFYSELYHLTKKVRNIWCCFNGII